MKRIAVLVVPLCVLLGAAAPAAESLPAYLTLPPAAAIRDMRTLVVEEYGEAEFRQHDGHRLAVQRGKHWAASLTLAGAPPKATGKDAWLILKPALVAGGWTVADEFDANPFSAVARYQKDGKDVWASFEIFGPSDIRTQIIEVGAPAIAFSIAAPAASPEAVSTTSGDFPYLPPLPGATFNRSWRDDAPLLVRLAGSNEAQVVGTGTIDKAYVEPAGISNLSFVTTYKTALTAAGWEIVGESESLHQTDSGLTAHYARNGRNLWAELHRGNGVIVIRVADAGADALAAAFARDCHAALYGVLFDFNKATLKPESDAVLEQVRAMLSKDPALALEVQGHTDNVGNDAYNQTLSEARAKSVVGWLVAHGVSAGRLTAKGYGKTRPVASNNDEAGRARNRRVEIAKPGCAAK